MKKSFTLTLLCLLAFFSANAQVNNLYVSPTGWAMWDEDTNTSLTSYQIYLDGELIDNDLSVPYFQHENLVDGQEYTTTVIPVYTDGAGYPKNYIWTKANCDDYVGAYDLKAEFIDNVGVVSWTLPAIYKGDKSAKDGSWLKYDNGTYAERIGLTYDGVNFESFKWAIMFPASDIAQYAGQTMTKVALYDVESFEGEVEIYEGGTTEPGTLLHKQAFSCAGTQDFHEITLTNAVVLSGDKNVWVVFTNINGAQPAAGCADQGNANGRWIYYDGYGWLDLMYVSYPAYTWMVRAYIGEADEPVISEVIGAILYRNGELLSPLVKEEEYHDADAQNGDEYTIRVVYSGPKDELHYFMTCPQSVTISNVAVEENAINDIMVYPNPANAYLNIEAKNMNHICIVNALGQVVYDKEVGSEKEIIDMTQYKDGIYLVRVTTENGVVVKQVSVK
ncbi:MAG: T9SS type A sorting domain-containing protein [Bacteroidales bacterium]|nr:T9SS type A sorting domain-containing protein [Bacteroidales bacterium]